MSRIFSETIEAVSWRRIADQKGCPTWTGDLSDALIAMVDRIRKNGSEMPWGTYHFCGSGSASWYEFALAIVEEASNREASRVLRVLPTTTSDYPTPAKRPMWSVMDCCKIQNNFDIHTRQWEKALVIMLEELNDMNRKIITSQ